MKLLTKQNEDKLRRNWYKREDEKNGGHVIDFRPVVKLFTPDAQCTWLLTEIDPEDGDSMYGLCDLGLGEPELGYVSLTELKSLRGKMGLPVERDRSFIPNKTISEYSKDARLKGRVVA